MEYMNPYSLKAQLLREQKLKWDEINEQRLLDHTEPLYSNTFSQYNMTSNIQDHNFMNGNAQQSSKKAMLGR